MSRITNAIKAALAELAKEETHVVMVDECTLRRLTAALRTFFEYIVYEGAFYTQDFFKVVYRYGKCSVEVDVLETVFRNFLRESYNLPADAPLYVWCYLDGERLVLFQAYTDRAKVWLQEQKNSERSRMLPSRDVLEE